MTETEIRAARRERARKFLKKPTTAKQLAALLGVRLPVAQNDIKALEARAVGYARQGKRGCQARVWQVGR